MFTRRRETLAARPDKHLYVDGQILSRIIDGKFVEEWVHWDTLGLLRQIGAVPPQTMTGQVPR